MTVAACYSGVKNGLKKLDKPDIRSIPKISTQTRFKDVLKRGFDIVFSALVLFFLLPVYGLIALAIKHDTPGPVFYRGERIGRNGARFKILKFRTMYETPESYAGPRITANDDPRITPLGRWLRDTKLNELPQFWNVFIGNMSLVGPRPEDPQLVAEWSEETAQEILSVRPGITSPASVQYHDEENLLQTREVLSRYIENLSPDKQRMDLLYVRNRSFAMDLDVLLWTALILLPRMQANPPPEELLFVGPVTRFIRWYLNWFILDSFITFISFILAAAIGHYSFLSQGMFWKFVVVIIGYTLLFNAICLARGVNRISWSKATFVDAVDLVLTWAIASGIMLLLNQLLQMCPTPVVAGAALASLIGFIGLRFRSRLITTFLTRFIRKKHMDKATRERVLIVGSGRTAESVAWMFDHPSFIQRFKVVGFVDDNLLTKGYRIYGGKVIGKPQDIETLVKKYDVGVILMADHRLKSKNRTSMLRACAATGARVYEVPDIYGALIEIKPSSSPRIPEKSEDPDECDICSYCLARQTKNQKDTPDTSEN